MRPREVALGFRFHGNASGAHLVDEQLLSTIVGLDEPEALGRIEPLNGASLPLALGLLLHGFC